RLARRIFFAVTTLLVGDVARDLRDPDDASAAVENRRGPDGHVDARPVAPHAHSLEHRNPLALRDAPDDVLLLGSAIGGNDQVVGLPDRLMGAVTIQLFCRGIP